MVQSNEDTKLYLHHCYKLPEAILGFRTRRVTKRDPITKIPLSVCLTVLRYLI